MDAERLTPGERFGIIGRRKRLLAAGALAALAAAPAWCAALEVADEFMLRQNASSTLTPAAADAGDGTYPASAPQPYFWFDANDTTGWVFTNYSDNASCVHTVPSKAGSKLAGTRWLSTDVTVASSASAGDGDEWCGWWASTSADCTTATLPCPPVYRTDDETLVGGRCLDFLTYGSRRALVFNSVTEDGCTAASNSLKRIGTVIAVYGSQNGGGWFLGGGGEGSFIRWHRGLTEKTASGGYNEKSFMNTVTREMGNSWALYGVLRHDGLPTSPWMVGFNGGWEVLSWIFTSADGMAHGPGIGDGRPGMSWRSGGQRIAEMIFYDSVLSVDDVKKVEAYLQRKWFGRTGADGAGGSRIWRLVSSTNANSKASAAGATTELAVGRGESLEVVSLAGGRGRQATVRKTGAGRLRLGATDGWGGALDLAGGTLDYPALRQVPGADALPRDCFAHFDASDEASLSVYRDEGGDTLWFNGLSNLVSTAVNGKAFYLRCYASCRSEVLKDCPSRGLNVIDLGDMTQYGGRYLQYTTEAPSATETNITERLSLSGVTTMVAAFHARGTGPSLADAKAFERKWLATYNAWHNVGILRTNECDDVRHLAPTDGVAFVNGLKVDPAGRLLSPGFQVVAVQTPGAGITRFGINSDGQYRGGAQLGELFLYRRPLSETELRDVSAYLLRKWLGRTAPGYAEAGGGVEREVGAQSVVASAETEVDVSAGRSVRFGALGGEARIVKTGAGALDVGVATGAVSVAEGTLTVSGPRAPATDCELAADPLMHFDPNARSRQLVVKTEGGVDYVATWEDEARRRALCAWSGSCLPWIADDAASTNRCLDFGTAGAGGPFMHLDSPVHSLRSAYVVWRPKDHASDDPAQMLGMYAKAPDGEDSTDQTRQKSGSDFPLFVVQDSPMATGEIWTNGVRTTRFALPATNEFTLVEVHTAQPAYFSAIASGNNSTRYGGSSFGDVLVYDRPLTEREKVATRNYLMRKWFGAEPQPLPDAAEPEEMVSLDVAEGASATIASPAAVRAVTGAGALSVTADATVGDLGAFAGAVSVSGGATLALANATPKVAPALATEGRIAHFDMSDASTLTLEEQDGYVGVAEWRSKVGDGVKAVCGSKYFSALSASMPRYMANSLNGMPTMLLYQSGSNFMLFEDAQGVTNDLVGIKTVFWVLGTANGRPGGFLLGGGRAYNGYFWHRGGSGAGAYRAEDPLTCKSASRFVWGGRWWKDGVSVDGCAEGLDANSWHYLCFQPAEGETGSGYATGFAFDGRIIQGTGYWNNFRHRTGNQNLAEVIIYDRVLTEEERLATETYLAVKWGLLMSGEVTCGVEVASGATVDLGGNEVAMTSVTGGGAVSNGTLTASALVADAAATSWPAVDGTFRIAPGQKVAFANLPQGGSSFFDVKILSAKAFEGTENLASAVFEGVPDGVCARLRVRDGYLVARHGAPGTVIVVR